MFTSVNTLLRLGQRPLSVFLKYESLSQNILPKKSRSCSNSQNISKDNIKLENSKFINVDEVNKENTKCVRHSNETIKSDLLDPEGRIPLETFSPYISPTFNFAAYINKSPTLQELVKLGVNLHLWEKKKGIPQYVMKLNFERDMKNTIRFLHDNGVPADRLGFFITKNPLIFKEKIDDLTIRINYLESKKFTSEMVAQVVTKNPYWLMFTTSRIDRRLGHFQRTFELSGSEIRALSTKQPRLITYNMDHIKEVTFAVTEIMGFQGNEAKRLLLRKPKLWMMNHHALISRFNYIHNEMGIPHNQLTETPNVLESRLFRIRQRHLFLEKYCPKLPEGSSRYDPKSIGYLSLDTLISGDDAEFCSDVAKVSSESFNTFLKSL